MSPRHRQWATAPAAAGPAPPPAPRSQRQPPRPTKTASGRNSDLHESLDKDLADMNFLSRLKLWQKLGVLVVAMAIPTALLGVFYLGGANSQVALAKDEIEGARYVQAVGGVLAEAANHRSRLFAVLTGDTASRDQVSASESEMQRHIEEVDASDAQVGSRFKVADAWASIKSDWERLKSEGAKLTPD